MLISFISLAMQLGQAKADVTIAADSQYLTSYAEELFSLEKPTDEIILNSLGDSRKFDMLVIRFPEVIHAEPIDGTPLAIVLGHTLEPHLYRQIVGQSRTSNFLQLCRTFALAGGDLAQPQKKVDPVRGSGIGWTLEKSVTNKAPDILPEYKQIENLSKRRKNR